MADDDIPLAATAPVIRGGEDASQHRLRAQCVEKIAADPQRPRVARLAALRQIEAARTPGADARKRFLPLTKLFPKRIRDRRKPGALIPPRLTHAQFRGAHFDQFLWVLDR